MSRQKIQSRKSHQLVTNQRVNPKKTKTTKPRVQESSFSKNLRIDCKQLGKLTCATTLLFTAICALYLLVFFIMGGYLEYMHWVRKNIS